MRMDSFPRFTRSGMFKELLVQDLDGKQLPVLDITPIVPPQESIPVQDVSSGDSVKTRVTRANSTKVSVDVKMCMSMYWCVSNVVCVCFRIDNDYLSACLCVCVCVLYTLNYTLLP